MEAVQLFWTGPWPELNFLYEAPSDFPELEARFHVKVDLLQTIAVVDFTIAQDMISTITVFWNEIIEKLVEWLILTVWTKISLAAWAVLEKNPEAGLAVLAIALTATFCACGVPIFYSDILIDSGWEPGWIAAVLVM